MDIQLYAYGPAPLALSEHISHAGLQCTALSNLLEARRGLPLLLVYADPLEAIQDNRDAPSLTLAGVPLDRLLDLQAAGIRCRLVNASCVSLPALVAWCMDPVMPIPNPVLPRFAAPDPFDALLTLGWLNEHPEHLEAYQALESHPLAAALDGRPPDLDCLARYQQAANLDALLAARQERAALEADLVELVQQLAPLQERQLEAMALHQQLDLLQARLRQADALQERCSELQLSLQAQQLDLEQLARRLALLEQLVSAGSDASQRLQGRLAQALA